MTRAGIAIFGLWLAMAGAVYADGASPVVVELYTSQGCSSCPPADELLGELSASEDVIPLALHVDYWDYIGWKDIFADPAFTQRQKAYARAAGSRSIYTPQIVVAGAEHVVGFRPMELAELIQHHMFAPTPVSMQMERRDGRVFVTAQSKAPLKGAVVLQLVRYVPQATVEIDRGENAGRTITYSNIVTAWNPVAEWDGRAPFAKSFKVDGDGPVVAIFQEQGPGRILAAARLR